MLKVKPWQINLTPFIVCKPRVVVGAADKSLAKIKAVNSQNRLGLVAIDEAHLVYDWQDFRQMYKKCSELHELLPNVPIMALSATVTVQVEEAMKSLLRDPIASITKFS